MANNLKSYRVGTTFYIDAESLFNALKIKELTLAEWVEFIVYDEFHLEDHMVIENTLVLKTFYAKELASVANTKTSYEVKKEIRAIESIDPIDDIINNIPMKEDIVERRVRSTLNLLHESGKLEREYTERFVNNLVAAIDKLDTTLKITLLREVNNGISKFGTRCDDDDHLFLLLLNKGVSDKYAATALSSRGGLKTTINVKEAEIAAKNERIKELEEEILELKAQLNNNPTVQLDETALSRAILQALGINK